MTKEEPSNQTATLERTLGLRDLILLIIGTVIGSGMFIVPGAVLRQVQGRVALAMLCLARRRNPLAARCLNLRGTRRDESQGGRDLHLHT